MSLKYTIIDSLKRIFLKKVSMDERSHALREAEKRKKKKKN